MALVFVSYSRKDEKFVKRLVTDLRSHNVPIWLDQKDIAPGQRWDMAIENALDQASHVVYVMSKASTQSNNVRDELDTAIDAGKILFPVLIEDCQPPLRVRRMQYTDFRHDYDEGLAKLLEILPTNGNYSQTAPVRIPGSARASTKRRTLPWLGLGVLAAVLVLLVMVGAVFVAMSSGKLAAVPSPSAIGAAAGTGTSTPTIGTSATPTPGAIATIVTPSVDNTPIVNNSGGSAPNQPQPTTSTPTRTPTLTYTPTPSQVTIQPRVPTINVRNGPGTIYVIIGTLSSAQILQAIGISADGRWFVVNVGGGIGWVGSDVVQVTGNPSILPVYPAPPTPTFTFTPTADIGAQAVETCNKFASVSAFQLSADDVKLAIDQCSIAVKVSSNNTTAWLELCILHNNYSSTMSPFTDYKAAFDECSAALKLDPKNAYTYLYRADAQYQLQDYKSAIVDLNAAIEIDPNTGEFYLQRGYNYRALGDCKEASLDFGNAEKFQDSADRAKQALDSLKC